MNLRLLVLICSAIFGSMTVAGQSRVDKPPAIRVDGPTVVAFWSLNHEKDVAIAEDKEALSDFQFNAGKMKDSFSKRGIRFHEIYATSFILIIGNGTSVVRAKQFEHGVGYYLIAPGKKPRIEQGVMTNSDLQEVAGKYFSESSK